MSVPYYPGSLYTPNLGLALYSVDSIIAENFVILDAAYGAGSSINVNGTLVESPNLSSTTPAAPGGQELVTFQYDSNGNISAYVPIPAAGGVTSFTGDSVVYNNAASTGAVSLSLIAQTENTVLAGPTTGANAAPTFRALVAADLPAGTSAWSSLTGTLSNGQVIPYADAGISRISAGVLGIGTGAQGSVAGGLELKTLQILDSAANVDFLLKNTTAATSSTPQSSPIFEIEGAWWGGGLASATDGWSIQNVPSSSTTLASGLITHVVETAGSGVTLTLTSGGTTFATYSWVIFQGFTTATWLNGVPIQISTASAISITFTDPTNHGTLASTADTASAAQATSYLTFSQISGSASLGVIQLLNPTAGNVATTNQSPILQFAAYYDSAGASALDTWNLYSDLQEGSNAQSNLDIVRIGGTGIAQINFCGVTPIFVFQNNNSATAPTAQFRFTGGSATTLPGSGTVYWGFGSHEYAASGTFEIFGGSGTVSNAVEVFAANGSCGIGIGNLTPAVTLSVYNAKASTGATQLLVQGGAAAADATTNALFQVNAGGGTSLVHAVLGNGTVQMTNPTAQTSGGGTLSSPSLVLQFNQYLGVSTPSLWTFTASGTATSASSLLIAESGGSGASGSTVGITGSNVILSVGAAAGNTSSTGSVYCENVVCPDGTNYKMALSASAKILKLSSDSEIAWYNNVSYASGSADSGISRLGAASLAIGNGTASDKSGTLALSRIDSYSADMQGSVSSAPTGIVATAVVVAVGAATATFTVSSTEGFTVGNTVTLSAGGWAGGSGLASSTATVTSIANTTSMVLTRASGGPWVAGTYTTQTGTLTQTGGTSVSVIYAVAYTSTPTVVASPTSNCGTWYISASSNTGFTITYANSGTQTFNYHVMGNPT